MTKPPRFGDNRRMRVGILGGSFNPAHVGHLHFALTALKRLRLDQVWLLVSPGNPLKDATTLAPLADRLASATAIGERAGGAGRRVVATDIERYLNTRYTRDTLRALHMRFPNARFVWLMGADNLTQLPHWRDWMGHRAHNALCDTATATLHSGGSGRSGGKAACAGAPPSRRCTDDCRLPSACVGFSRRPGGSLVGDRTAQVEDIRRTPIARKPTPPPPEPGTAKPAAKRRVPKAPVSLAEAAKSPGTPRKKAAVAGPRGAPRRDLQGDTEALDRLQTVIVTSLEDDKAEAVTALDLAGRASFADRMVIATGLADRQIVAMATHLEEKLHAAGVKRVRIEGAHGSDWVLIDAGDIVIHLFKPDARALYALEKMWGAEFDEPAVQAG